jgi:hypothetical protein
MKLLNADGSVLSFLHAAVNISTTAKSSGCIQQEGRDYRRVAGDWTTIESSLASEWIPTRKL